MLAVLGVYQMTEYKIGLEADTTVMTSIHHSALCDIIMPPIHNQAGYLLLLALQVLNPSRVCRKKLCPTKCINSAATTQCRELKTWHVVLSIWRRHRSFASAIITRMLLSFQVEWISINSLQIYCINKLFQDDCMWPVSLTPQPWKPYPLIYL